jgi:hypothetical protein
MIKIRTKLYKETMSQVHHITLFLNYILHKKIEFTHKQMSQIHLLSNRLILIVYGILTNEE